MPLFSGSFLSGVVSLYMMREASFSSLQQWWAASRGGELSYERWCILFRIGCAGVRTMRRLSERQALNKTDILFFGVLAFFLLPIFVGKRLREE
jgi:hypothetical protein